MKGYRKRLKFVPFLLAGLLNGVVPAPAQTQPTTFVGHVDVGPYAFILLPVDQEDVAPYVPEGFRSSTPAGPATLVFFFGPFRNLSVDLENGVSRQEPGRFWVTEIAVIPYGPEGGGLDSAGLLYLRRYWGSPVFPQATATLGVACGGKQSHTHVCHVPQTRGTVTRSPTATTLDVRGKGHSASVTFAPTTLPCAFCRPELAVWHVGSRGPVRESVSFAPYPTSAITGVGIGTVHAARGSDLYRMLGDREQASGVATVVRGHIDANFELV